MRTQATKEGHENRRTTGSEDPRSSRRTERRRPPACLPSRPHLLMVDERNGLPPPATRVDDARHVAPARHRVAIMQPYYFPYAGYFRLFVEADEFIVYDCVQFPRRGRIHRCQVPGPDGREEWLTLPLVHQARTTLIRDLRFTDDARAVMERKLARLPWFRSAHGANAARVREHLLDPHGGVADYLEAGLRLVLGILGIDARMRRSSEFDIDPALRGQERILAICRASGADAYLNPPGGRELYDAGHFARSGIGLDFLPEYHGRHFHLLPALMGLPAADLRADILGSHPCAGPPPVPSPPADEA
jgi:hypothetical protein